MNEADLITYLASAFRWLGIIWGSVVIACFVLYFVFCAASGAGEGSAEEGDES